MWIPVSARFNISNVNMKLIFLARSRKKETFLPVYCTFYNIYVFLGNICSHLQGVRAECLSDECANLMLDTQLSTNVEKTWLHSKMLLIVFMMCLTSSPVA
jgi:hypothetical protein